MRWPGVVTARVVKPNPIPVSEFASLRGLQDYYVTVVNRDTAQVGRAVLVIHELFPGRFEVLFMEVVDVLAARVGMGTATVLFPRGLPMQVGVSGTVALLPGRPARLLFPGSALCHFTCEARPVYVVIHGMPVGSIILVYLVGVASTHPT